MLNTTRFIREVAAKYGTSPTTFEEAAVLPQAEFFNLLEDYYLNNGLYWLLEQLMVMKAQSFFDNRRALRNPCHAAVEFYAGKLWPGPLAVGLPITTDNQSLIKPLKQIFEWSNWGQNKQLMSRKFSMLGTVLLKVNLSTDKTRVFIQLIDPRVIPDNGFLLDERGFLTYLRMDILNETVSEGQNQTWWTEVWTKFDQGVTYQLYLHEEGFGTPLSELQDHLVMSKSTGEPASVEFADNFLPFDYIPVAFIPFRDIGNKYGLGCYVQSLDKIDEANLLATRLHSLIYNTDAIWALKANAKDPQGRPLPAPDIQMSGQGDGSTIKLGSLTMVKLPGNADLVPLVPELNFAALLTVLQDQVQEIERDLPESRYYRVVSQAPDLSGRAIELLLGDAIDRVVEARGNGEEGLKRALQMALSMGVSYGIFEKNIGTFAAGDFEFGFKSRPVIQPTMKEVFEVVQLATGSGVPLETALSIANFDQTTIDQTITALQAQAEREQATLAAAILKAQVANKPPAGQEATNQNTNLEAEGTVS